MKKVEIVFKNNKVDVEPETVYLEKGESLIWQIQSTQSMIETSMGDLMSLKEVNRFGWEIYFEENSPFSFGQTKLFKLITELNQAGEIKTNSADIAGEFKYGIRIKNADDDEIIEDEDPHIIVR